MRGGAFIIPGRLNKHYYIRNIINMGFTEKQKVVNRFEDGEE